MNMDKIAVFRMTTGKMGWLAERQRVLSQNIANSDTPEYRPRDLQKVDFRQNVRGLDSMRLRKTHVNHVSLGVEEQKFKFESLRDPYETAPSGNAVVLEEQMVKVAQTSGDYELMTSLYRKLAAMLKIALGKGQGQ